MKDTKKTAYSVPGFDRYMLYDCDVIFLYLDFCYRIALLQRQLLEVRDKIGYTKYQHSHKTDGPSDSDKQELRGLEARERGILDKIADAEQQLEGEEFDDTVSVAYKCDKCERSIEGMMLYPRVSVNLYW